MIYDSHSGEGGHTETGSDTNPNAGTTDDDDSGDDDSGDDNSGDDDSGDDDSGDDESDTAVAYVNPDAADGGTAGGLDVGADMASALAAQAAAHGGDPINPNTGLGGDAGTDGTIHVTPSAGPDVNPDADGSGGTGTFAGTGSGSTRPLHQPLDGDPINPALDLGPAPFTPPVDDGGNPYASDFTTTMVTAMSGDGPASSADTMSGLDTAAAAGDGGQVTGTASTPAFADDFSIGTAIETAAQAQTTGLAAAPTGSVGGAGYSPGLPEAQPTPSETAPAEPAADAAQDAPVVEIDLPGHDAAAAVAPHTVEAPQSDQSQLAHTDPGPSANEPPTDASDTNPVDGSLP